ncbi:hypothetical protein SNE40_004930 [Patella caerulea]|uniref:Uncharacterized protein n=1 Tax=Patella caerulea TaxID=87958 RepID=A0AAN8QD24_PATCE
MFPLKLIPRCISQFPSILYQPSSKIHSLTASVYRLPNTFSSHQLIKPVDPIQSSTDSLLKPSHGKEVFGCPSCNVQQVRNGQRQHYSYSAWKRINKFGIERLLSTKNGRTVLWRRFLKGKHNYAAFEQLLPEEFNGRILPKHQKHLQNVKYKEKIRYIP